ncbi:MAG: hypothetical protein F4Y88_08135 [Chloroflexi bacterium]|nr:hypothetical protein [Chloroflexota bacterium]
MTIEVSPDHTYLVDYEIGIISCVKSRLTIDVYDSTFVKHRALQVDFNDEDTAREQFEKIQKQLESRDKPSFAGRSPVGPTKNF